MSSPNLENNKIFAAILVAGIVAMLSGFVSNKFVHSKSLDEDAYPIEVPETPVAGGVVVEPTVELIDGLMAAADPLRGEKLTRACMACHSMDKGGPNKIGPNLWNVYNNVPGHHAEFAYSDAMKNHGGAWDTATLNEFLWKPKKTIPGTKMNYIGLKKPQDRADIIKYLQTLK